jgi:CRISPR-associated protein Cas2
VGRLHLVVAYDVSENRRRARLAKRLRAFLDRVQKSVFEGQMDERRLDTLRRTVEREIDQNCDSARVYHLCARCRAAVEIIGTGTYVEDGQRDLVF